MIKVKMLSALAYRDNSTVQPGQIVDLDNEKAENLIKNNLAVFLCNIVDATEIEEPKATRKRKKKSEE